MRGACAAALVVSLAGCYTGLTEGADQADAAGVVDDGGSDDSGGDGGDDGDGPPSAPTDSVPAQAVPDQLDTVSAEGFCVSPAAGQSVAGVSPDGFVWLAQSMPGAGGADAVRFEVVDPWTGATTLAPADLELGAMVAINPRSADDAVVVAADALWHVDAWSRVELVPPAGFSGSASACGNPRDNGFLLSGGSLHEHRPDAWWGLTVPGTDDGIPDRIVAFDGECTGPADETILTAPDGTVWRVSVDGVVKGLRFDGFTAAAATGPTLAVLADAELWLGPDEWTRWTFEAGAPTTIAASDEQVWIAVGSRVLRAAGGEFSELSAPGEGDIEAILAHPGGLWIQRAEGQLCHAAVGPQLRVDAIHPYQRTAEHELAFAVVPEDAGVTVEATFDGEALTLLPGTGGEITGLLHLESLGWHRVELVAEHTDGATSRRTLWLRREVPELVSFAADVAPIAAEHCSGAACHTSMTTAGVPVLETLEAWAQHIDKIEERVVELDNMPPVGVRAESWGSDEVETIAKWIEGGMLP